MSPLIRGLLRPALNTIIAAALAGLVALGGSSSGDPSAPVRPHQVHEVAPDIALSAAVVTTNAKQIVSTRGARVLRVAKAQTGDPYRYGATGPGAFDCSGLTSYAYRIATGKHLPHNSSAQQGSTHRVSAASARPGDLVFFHDGGHVYHVAIYAGRHTVIHAPYPGQRVKRERIWTSAVTYGRVV